MGNYGHIYDCWGVLRVFVGEHVVVTCPYYARPLIVGMNNPLSVDPMFDLYPYPEGSTGWRLWKMMPRGTTRSAYLGAFDRRNLLRSREWSPVDARAEAVRLLPKLDKRVVVVLGTEVRAALGLPKVEPLTVTRTCVELSRRKQVSFTWLALPHPSGRNHWYNDPANLRRTKRVLAGLMRGEYEVSGWGLLS